MKQNIYPIIRYCPVQRKDDTVYIYFAVKNDELVFLGFNGCNFQYPCEEFNQCKENAIKVFLANHPEWQ